MATIKSVDANQILNSRGQPTVEVEITLSSNESFRASCPAGISRGTREVIALADKDFGRFQGREVNNAVKKVREVIGPQIKGINPVEQSLIDRKMIETDGTPNRANLGVNSILPVSLAAARAGAHMAKKRLFDHINSYFNIIAVQVGDQKIESTEYEFSLPRPAMLMAEGGKHGFSGSGFQEYFLIPQKLRTIDKQTSPLWEQLRCGSETFRTLGQLLQESSQLCGYGEEGGFITTIDSCQEIVNLIIRAAKQNDYEAQEDYTLGIDVAAASLAAGTAPEVSFYQNLAQNYPLEVLEDAFGENDWNQWKALKDQLPETTFLVGDDLTVTHLELVAQAVRENAVSGIVIKPDQIGTVTETLRVAKFAKFNGLKLMVSHRGGETNGTFIADLAAAIGADFLKAGAPNRGERVAKYNRLLEIGRMIDL